MLVCKLFSSYFYYCTFQYQGLLDAFFPIFLCILLFYNPESGSHKHHCHFVQFCLQTLLHVVTMMGSVAFYFIFSLIYNATCVLCNPPTNPYWIMERQLSDPIFYLLCLITPVIALLPRFEWCAVFLSVFFVWICRYLSEKTVIILICIDKWYVGHMCCTGKSDQCGSQVFSTWTINLFGYITLDKSFYIYCFCFPIRENFLSGLVQSLTGMNLLHKCLLS